MKENPVRSRNLTRMLILGLAAAAVSTCGEKQTPTSPGGPNPTSRLLNQRIDTALRAFESVYAMPLEEAERRWHDFLRGS